MADGGTSTFWVAVYGAVLSTVLALVKLIPEWPMVIVGPVEIRGADQAATVSVRIIYPAKRPLFIQGSIQLPPWKKRFHIIAERPLDLRETIVRNYEERQGYHRPGRLRLHVPPAETMLLTVSGIGAGQTRWIVFWWHRNWLLRWLLLPASVRVSPALAAVMNGV
jgi:hypothetical protein